MYLGRFFRLLHKRLPLTGVWQNIIAIRNRFAKIHILANGKKANIPSMVLKPGDVISVKSKTGSREYAKQTLEIVESRGLVPWLSLDKANFSGEILHVPSRDEIAPTINEQLVVELYSK